jgi:hypothetical protein
MLGPYNRRENLGNVKNPRNIGRIKEQPHILTGSWDFEKFAEMILVVHIFQTLE